MTNWIRYYNIFGSTALSGLLGIGIANVIGIMNGNMVYGHYASYFVTALLVLIFNVHYIDFGNKVKP